MKLSKIIGLIIGVTQMGSAIALLIGMHVILGIYATALPNGEQGIEIQFSDPVVIPLTLAPVNNGYFDATMEVSIGLMVDGVEVTSDSTLVTIPSGSTVPVDLELILSLTEAQEYLQEGADLEWETSIMVTTLYDFISFSNHMVTVGGAQ